MIYNIATGMRIDPDRAERFGVQVDDLYSNPFDKKKQEEPKTPEEIKQHVLKRLLKGVKHNGSDDFSCQDNA